MRCVSVADGLQLATPPDVVNLLGHRSLREPWLSVVVATLNEAGCLEATLKAAVLGAGGAVEVVVSDAGSTDGTRELAEELPSRAWWPAGARLRLVSGARGRGGQLQRGVAASEGDLVVLLHADTRLQPGWAALVRRALDEPGVALGAFAFDLDELQGGGACKLLGMQLRFVRWCTNLRARVLELPYGDQALFLRRGLLEELGGVPKQPLLEDVELVRRARRLGHVRILREPGGAAITSARRWRERGLLRTTGLNLAVLLAYSLGVSADTLVGLYYGKRRKAE